MNYTDIDKEIKILTKSLNNLNNIKKNFDILKKKYKSLYLKKDQDDNYNLYVEYEDINFDLAKPIYKEHEGSLYYGIVINDICQIKTEFFIEAINTYKHAFYLEMICYDDYYHFASSFKDPQKIIYEIESKILQIISSIHKSYTINIINKTNSDKVQRFIDNLIFS